MGALPTEWSTPPVGVRTRRDGTSFWNGSGLRASIAAALPTNVEARCRCDNPRRSGIRLVAIALLNAAASTARAPRPNRFVHAEPHRQAGAPDLALQPMAVRPSSSGSSRTSTSHRAVPSASKQFGKSRKQRTRVPVIPTSHPTTMWRHGQVMPDAHCAHFGVNSCAL